jgi:hypothetical protein
MFAAELSLGLISAPEAEVYMCTHNLLLNFACSASGAGDAYLFVHGELVPLNLTYSSCYR